MVNGNNGRVQFAVEATYGTAPTMSKQIKIASEAFKWVPDKKDEGLLTGGKSTGKVYTMSKKAEGAISTNVRPDEAGYWLGAALGVEGAITGTTPAYTHTFTSAEYDDSLPSMAFVVDRMVDVYAYTGCKINTLSFSAQPGDYLKVDATFVGKDEVDGTAATLTPSPLKPLRFSHAAVTLASSTYADVTSIKFDYNNNLDVSLQTTSTGMYFVEPEAGAREIKIDLEALYSAASDAIRSTYFKTDDSVALEIKFTSDEEIDTGVFYELTITIPHCQITEAGPANIGGADTLKQSVSLKAIEEGGDELITVKLINGMATKYFA